MKYLTEEPAATAAATKGESVAERREDKEPGRLEEEVTEEPKLENSDPSGKRMGSVTTVDPPNPGVVLLSLKIEK